MWTLSADGTFAKNEETGKICKIELCRDKLYRVKKNYKTIGTFTTMDDAKIFFADTVKMWNEADGDV